MLFMSTYAEPNETQQSSTIVRIIDKLAGDKANFKLSFHELKFHVGKRKYTLNGEVNFNVVHSTKPET